MDYSQLGNKKRKRLQNPHATRMRNKIGLLILRVTLAVVMVGIVAGIGTFIGVYEGILDGSPNLDISGLGSLSATEGEGGAFGVYLSSFIVCAQTGEERERLHAGHNHEFVYLSQMPQHLIYAFVAIEDERFFEHNGVDPRGMVRAMYVIAMTDQPTQGASTITQQLVKNMLGVWDNNFITKLQEQHLAVNFERHLIEEFERLGYEDPHQEAKNFIIQSYLNIINLGRQNYGVQAAAWFYYGVDVSELTMVQAATIAAITQNPSRFPPDIRPRNNWERTQLVLRNMHRLGFITDAEFAEASEQRQFIDPATGTPLYDEDGEPVMIGTVYDTIFRTDGGGTRPLMSDFDCFTDALLDQVREDLIRQNHMTAAQANHIIFTQGIRIYSTQDLEKQAIVDRAFLDSSLWPGPGLGFSIEVTHYMTLRCTITQMPRHYRRRREGVPTLEAAEAFVEEVRATYQRDTDERIDERTFKLEQPQGAFVLIDHHTGHVLAIRGIRGEKQGNRAFNRATQATRSPGSQMKPLVPFGPMFDMGLMQPSTVIDDVPFHYGNPGGRGWSPSNWYTSPYPYEGLTTARRAIYRSQNVASAIAAVDAGMPMMVRFLEQIGISTISQHDGPAIVLGGISRGTHLIELAGAYAAVANLGEFNRPVLYTQVLDHEGNILLYNPHNPQRAMRATTAYLLTSSMRDTMGRAGSTGGRANWTDSGLRGRIPIAGKTGTSQRNRDLGFAGYTPYFTAAIWMGNDNEQPMHRRSNEFHTPLWRVIMQEIHQDLPARSFERPAGIVSASACRDSGLTPTELCLADPRGSRSLGEIFAPGMAPAAHCHVHQRFTYCTESNRLATDNCPYWAVVTRVGIVRDVPIDDVEARVQDRRHEFPLAVREGLYCNYCVATNIWDGNVNDWNVNDWDFDPITNQWVPRVSPTPTPPWYYNPVPTPTPHGIPGVDFPFPSPTPTPIPTPPPTPTPPPQMGDWLGLGLTSDE
ncbi:MAG: transglycosylase domain-containing protein [Defluviitaleaceae bacterium]|nr:transglycosylase domain-containing protein [Defluviitaleaceae bacterium]